MAVIFPRWTNHLPLVLGVAGPIAGAVVVGAIWYWFSPQYTDVGYQPAQPVAFSHRQHAGELGIDCRYCHNTVEKAAHAAIPPAATCMNCHATIQKDSDKLALVRESYETGKPIEWIRVHMLPDYAFFDHSVHVAAGVGCASCHGRIDTMDVVRQVEPLSMAWCLECHKDPEPRLRPKHKVTDMAYDTARASYDPHKDALRTRQPEAPIHCSGCHR